MITMGTVMEIERKKALVFTMDGSAVYIRPRLGLFIGQQVAFAKKELVAGRRKLLAVLPFAAMAAAVLAVAVVTAGLFGAFGMAPAADSSQGAAYIALDINPSVQFTIDGDSIVLSARAMNADGRTLLASLSPVGKPVKTAVAEAIAKAKELGYIQDSKSVVLVAGTLNADNGDVTGQRSEYRDKLQSILGGMGGGGDADVLALYIDDSSIKENADSNGLSIGRELLREFAEQNDIDLDDSEIRSGKISDLLNKLSSKLDDPEKCTVVTQEPTGTPEATLAPTDSPTPVLVTATPTAAPTDAHTATPAKTNTPAPTNKATEPPDRPAAGVTCKLLSDGFKISWPKAGTGHGKFLYYKVVLSAHNSAPKYPGDGYAKAISDINATSATVKANSGYNGGDVGGKIKPGVTYYISVTYVYEGGSVYGNTVRAKCPTPPVTTEPPSFSGTVHVSVKSDHVYIYWDKAPTEDGFNY